MNYGRMREGMIPLWAGEGDVPTPAFITEASTRSLAASGAMIWLLVFCEVANLRAGWPIQPHRPVPRQTHLLWLGAELISTICLIQVAALVVAALRQSDRQVRDLAAEEPEDDVFTVPNEPDRRIELASAAAGDGPSIR